MQLGMIHVRIPLDTELFQALYFDIILLFLYHLALDFDPRDSSSTETLRVRSKQLHIALN